MNIKMQTVPTTMILPEGTISYDASLVPIDIGSRLVQPVRTQSVSIVELGKNLLMAARIGDTENVRDLMAKGAPFTTDWLGTSPLHFAAQNNHLETCEVLLRSGISRDARTKVDRTPLHMAAYEGHTGVVDTLIYNGADVDAKDMLKMTPLHWAVQNEHPDVVTTLLKHGANPDAVNKFDKTPVDLSMETNRMDILQLLQVITKDPLQATDSLAIELGAADGTPMEEEFIGEVNEIDEIEEEIPQPRFININRNIGIDANRQDQEGNVLADSMEILKEHGISYLPHDESSVVASAVENGHSLVLTEVGKQVLNCTKPLIKIPVQKTHLQSKIKGRKIVTVTTEQLFAMVSQKNGLFKRIPGGIVSLGDKPIKRVVMNKNKIMLSGVPNVVKRQKQEVQPDIESITRQLAEARRQAEEYKQMLKRKEAEAERYKRQLQSITQGK